MQLGTIQHPGQSTRKYLPGGLKLTADERAEIAGLICKMEAASMGGRSEHDARLALVSKMLLAYPMSGGSAESGRARGEAYLDALDDVPAWAIAEAVRAWNRGEAGDGHNYSFAPSPAILRSLALRRCEKHKAACQHLMDILSADDLETAMDAHRPAQGVAAKLRAMA